MKHQLSILLLGEISKSVHGNIFPIEALKSAPHYFKTSVPHQVIVGEEKITIDGREIILQLKGYSPDILLFQADIEVPSIFDESLLDLEERVLSHCYQLLKKRGGNEEFSEVYSIFSLSHYEGDPEPFLAKHGTSIVSLLKSERMKLDPKEVEHTLETNIKYAQHDLAIVDWDGAFLFDTQGNFAQTIELLTLANLQLLRYRITDRDLEERSAKMAKLAKAETRRASFLFKHKELEGELKAIIKGRAEAISQFQALERDIKLIGDWYQARLYDLAAKKFKLQEWKNSIKEKLESIEDIYSIVVENFTISGKHRAEWIQIIAFFVLQIGWFALIILEFFYFTR